ncbi:MAG: TlpA disulfide reductase family protein [Woeseiaceae bacterium]|nr:TlpA disulfide reductase family protein [Woeseiaceae bacterium]
MLAFFAVVLLGLLTGRPTLAGPAIDLDAFRGKVLVVDFWASWCVPCRRSFPWMNSMQEKYGEDGLVFIGVNMDADRELANAFLRAYPARFRIIHDPDGMLAREYDVVAMPSSYVFGRDGKLVTRHLGFKVKRQDEYEATIVELLSASREGR